ncbi:hypothetical protein VBI23_06830 [Streptococcus uberis]|uniref:hypothetical protein n=1 Tax=Streptococcus uberis TaxID=1349 RepID=UPI0037A27073
MQKNKTIYSANFEESLNLYDNGMSSLNNEEHLKIEKQTKNGIPSIWFTLKSIILTILFPILLNFFIVIISITIHEEKPSDLTIPISNVKLLTMNLYLIMLVFWLLLVLIGKRLKQAFILPYRYQFHVYSYMVWFVIELDIVAVEWILPSLSVIGTILTLLFLALITINIFLGSIKDIKTMIFEKSEEKPSNKTYDFIKTYGLGILSIGIIIKLILSSLELGLSGTVKLSILFIVWIIFNIIVVYAVFKVAMPYFLQGFYKLKYSEDYRNWENKSVEEWYGKKYLKKHKELIKND